jgi:hypothetical protein
VPWYDADAAQPRNVIGKAKPQGTDRRAVVDGQQTAVLSQVSADLVERFGQGATRRVKRWAQRIRLLRHVVYGLGVTLGGWHELRHQPA